LFIGFFSAVIAITLQHNMQLPQVLMGRPPRVESGDENVRRVQAAKRAL